MNWFPCFGTGVGFPWIMLIFPLLFFGMMLYFCSRRRSYGFFGCCMRRTESDYAAELAGLRRGLDDLKRKLG